MNDIDCEIQNVIDEIRIDENSSEYSWVFELTTIVERNLTASTHAYEYVINIIQNLNDYDEETTKDIKDLFRKSFENFGAGIHTFENINDILNIALLHSNLCRLMRYYA
ncbi:unnamed protein product [Rotaria sordida]|uniref:EDRF1 TPR repeats region domain-containing protein n=1 Tax=Rotaria sordida TaxID=392033 RepID=A0A819Q489_9BILA|nr:unnamed protein product [Rotaria sordida]CAF4020836.1 unnamed protein product [Rotaria sordida]